MLVRAVLSGAPKADTADLFDHFVEAGLERRQHARNQFAAASEYLV